MNPYVRHLSRLEFAVTYACTGRCKHCSEGDHLTSGGHIDGETAARAVRELCGAFAIESLMTFGGEPLLCADEACQIHAAAREMGIPRRHVITNGFFSRDEGRIKEVAANLAKSGVNQILLSADAFHQETIPLAPVKAFAAAAKGEGIPVRMNPAWLVSAQDDNPYNVRTREILAEFAALGIEARKGNVVFPSGNARVYLSEYFDLSKAQASPYDEDPEDIRAICVGPDGGVLGGNIYETGIVEILENYRPQKAEI